MDTITAYQAQGAWPEMSVTWRNKPSFGGSFGNVAVVADGNWGWRELDVTNLVQGWMNGTFANDGVMLRGEEQSGAESSRRSFYMREGDYPPELVVTYGGAANMQPMRPVVPDASEAQSVSIMQRLNASRSGDDSGREHQSAENVDLTNGRDASIVATTTEMKRR